MNNYTVVPNGLIVKNLPIEEKQLIKKIGISRRDLEQAIQTELRRPLTASEMIEQLDNLSREENV